MQRLRALDAICDDSNVLSNWKCVNEMFNTYIPIIDTALGSGIHGADMLYVPCTDGKEELKFCELLFSINIDLRTKRYILLGGVGTGKTTLVNKICHGTLSETFPDSYIFAAYKDVQRIASSKADEIVKDMTSKLRDAIIKQLFPYDGGELDLYTQINTKLLGPLLAKAETEKNPRQVLREGREVLTIQDYCRFLSCFSNNGKKLYVLLVMDNIDENSPDAISEILCAENRLFEALSDQGNHFFSCTLVPMRNYTRAKFENTERYAVADIFRYPASQILRVRLKLCEEEIRHSTRMFKFKGKSISPEEAANFIANLAEALLSKKQPEAFRLISDLAANNMKTLLANTYNMIHSPRLPYLHIFESAFAEKEPHKVSSIIPMEIACQCLMAVHYPFFDVSNSWIMNLFNVRVRADGFMNTLVTYRFMCLVNRYKKITYKNILQEFGSIGYDPSFVDQSITLCLKHGAIEASNGLSFHQINHATEFKWNSSTRIYMEQLVYSLSYLQYVCEDTPMPSHHIVKIQDKYSPEPNDSYENFRSARFSSARKFCQFLKEEENLEWEHIKKSPQNLCANRYEFNTQWSLNLNGYDCLSDKMEWGLRGQVAAITATYQNYRDA